MLMMCSNKLQILRNKYIYLTVFIVQNKHMGISFWQIAIVVVLVVLLFGRGKISSLMGDVAKGIKSFKKGMSSDENNQTNLEDKKDEDSNSQNK